MLDLVFAIFGFSFKILVLYAFLSLFNVSKVIKIDNLINESLYQDNQDFSKFTTKYRILAIYYLQNIISPTDLDNIKTTLSFSKKNKEIKH